MDQAEPVSSWIISSFHQVITQPKITTSIQQSSEEAYLKMLQIAYTLGLEPTLPSWQFKTLVKVHLENCVSLIEGERYLYLF